MSAAAADYDSSHVSTKNNAEVRPLGTASDDDDDSGKRVYKALQVEYDEMAHGYDNFWGAYLEETLKKPLALLCTFVEQQSSKKQFSSSSRLTVVDIACGTGVFLKRFIDEYCSSNKFGSNSNNEMLPKLIGVEPSTAMLKQAHAKFAEQERGAFHVQFKAAPAEQIPLSNESVNVLCSTNAFHFFKCKPTALQEMKRVLKKGSKLIITDWCNDYLLVFLYHNVIERLRWIGFRDGYPGPLGSKTMVELVKAAGFENVVMERYTVRFWFIVIWGMHTITATKSSSACNDI